MEQWEIFLRYKHMYLCYVNLLRLPVVSGALKIIDSSRISMDQLYKNQVRLEVLDSFVYNIQFIETFIVAIFLGFLDIWQTNCTNCCLAVTAQQHLMPQSS